MDCKKALHRSRRRLSTRPLKSLRLKGQKVAAKRGDRETGEGAILASTNGAGDFGALLA